MRRSQGFRVLSVGLLALVALSGCGTDSSSPASTSAVTGSGQGPQQIVDALVSSGGLVGVAAVVVTPGADGKAQVAYYNAGSSSVGGSPVTEQTTFEIGSLTKVFTADLLATLVAQGKISLSDPLQKYAPAGITVPTFTGADGVAVPITIGNLATHQAGLPDLPANAFAGCPSGTTSPTQCTDFYALYTRDMLWQGLAQTKLLSQPGTDWVYSNFGFGLLGTVLADLVQPGQGSPPYQAVLQSEVLSHFPMPNTAVETSGQTLATGYALNGSQPVAQAQFVDTNALAGAGGLVSTTTDLGVWLQAHLGYPVGTGANADQPLQQTLQLVDTAATVCSQQNPSQCTSQAPAAPQQMGLAWQLSPPVGEITQNWATKDGGTYGFNAQAFLAPGAKTGVVLLGNTVTAQQMQPQAVQMLVDALG